MQNTNAFCRNITIQVKKITNNGMKLTANNGMKLTAMSLLTSNYHSYIFLGREKLKLYITRSSSMI